jgi:hypothetical protein
VSADDIEFRLQRKSDGDEVAQRTPRLC